MRLPPLQKDELRIVLLGPGNAQPVDYQKRSSILEELKADGFARAKLGEETIGTTPYPLHMALLSHLPDIDLILVLNTGPGPLVELTALSLAPRARDITYVWWKRQHASRRRSTPSDVVRMFLNYPFSVDEFQSCDLNSAFIDVAERTCLNRAMTSGSILHLLLPPDEG